MGTGLFHPLVSPDVMRSTARTAGLCVLVGICVLAVGMTASGGVGVVGAAVEDPFEQMDIEAEDVVMEASVEPNGDATWTIEYRTRLATAEEEQAFEELRDDVDADPEPYTDGFRDRMETTVAESAEATDREMSVEDVNVSTKRRDLPREYGSLVYEFRWTGFAVVEGSRITAGDALDGLFLDDETAFIVSWPETHRLVDATPSPTETRDGSVVWVGPLEFTGEEPRVLVDADTTGVDDHESGPGTGLTAEPTFLLLGFVVLLTTVGIAFLAYRSRENASDDGFIRKSSPSSTTDSAGAARSSPAEGSVPGDDSASVTDADVDGAVERTAEPDAGDGNESPTGTDSALLSNEERVLRLIEEHDGRMKQARVAEELDWTAAKTSQVVTGLRDDGELDGFRLGRENVLSLPDEEE